jgi:hypothetical protein
MTASGIPPTRVETLGQPECMASKDAETASTVRREHHAVGWPATPLAGYQSYRARRSRTIVATFSSPTRLAMGRTSFHRERASTARPQVSRMTAR